MTLKDLESNTWVNERYELFRLMDVPNHQIEGMIIRKDFIEDRGRMTTIDSVRTFDTLPRWLKKRMKFRLDARRIGNYPELQHFVKGLVIPHGQSFEANV